MKRNILIASGTAGLMAFAATRLPAADEDALILQGTAGTTLAQEQQALKAARRQSDDARDRAALLAQQATAARDAAEQARRRAAAVAARIQQAEADIALPVFAAAKR